MIRVCKNASAILNTNNFIYVIKGTAIISISKSETFKRVYLCKLPRISILKRFLSIFKITKRLFRLFPRGECIGDDGVVIFSFDKKVFIFDSKKGMAFFLFSIQRGFTNPLYFAKAQHIKSNYLFYYGDYGQNKLSSEVSIHAVNRNLEDVIVYTFKKGSVKHIHNIIYSDIFDKYYVLTGDNDSESKIIEFSTDFTVRNDILSGSQKYRSCVAITNGFLLYFCTDAVEENNYLIEYNFESKDEKTVCELNGSVIYGRALGSYLIFSSTVEPTINTSRLGYYFSNRLGKGIKNHYSKLYCFNAIDKSLKIIDCGKKDLFNMRFFGYAFYSVCNNEEEALSDIVVTKRGMKKQDFNVCLLRCESL